MAFSRILSESLGALTTGALIYSLGGLLGVTVASRQPGGLAQMLAMPKRYLLGCGALFVAIFKTKMNGGEKWFVFVFLGKSTYCALVNCNGS